MEIKTPANSVLYERNYDLVFRGSVKERSEVRIDSHIEESMSWKDGKLVLKTTDGDVVI